MTEGGPERFSRPVRRIGVVLRRRAPEIRTVVERLVRFCASRGVDLAFEGDHPHEPAGAERLDIREAPVDLLLALGGDGTMLRAARVAMQARVPVFGVNLGRLGFLTATPETELEAGLSTVLDGAGVLDRRFTLQARVMRGAEPPRAGEGTEPPAVSAGPFEALNDIVVHTMGAARVTALQLMVRGNGDYEEVGSFSADGVIVATPTGSTAYSLSAGGPILVPDVSCLVVTAICPHSLSVRPLVLPSDEVLLLMPLFPGHGLQVTVDGQVEHALADDEYVVVERGPHEVALVRLPGQTFLQTMRRKLNWAARPPERA